MASSLHKCCVYICMNIKIQNTNESEHKIKNLKRRKTNFMRFRIHHLYVNLSCSILQLLLVFRIFNHASRIGFGVENFELDIRQTREIGLILIFYYS